MRRGWRRVRGRVSFFRFLANGFVPSWRWRAEQRAGADLINHEGFNQPAFDRGENRRRAVAARNHADHLRDFAQLIDLDADDAVAPGRGTLVAVRIDEPAADFA